MKSSSLMKNIIPHFIAIVVFIFITVYIFSPFFFENKYLEQHDISQWIGSAKEIKEYREKTNQEALWTNSMFSGMPAYLIDVKWNDSIVTVFKKILSLNFTHPICNFFLCFLCFYIFLLAHRVRSYLAIGGALAFGLSSYILIGLGAGHNSRIGAVAFVPLVLAGIHLLFSQKKVLGIGVAALGLSLHLRENHLQITYYLLMMLVIYMGIEFYFHIKNLKIKRFGKKLLLLFLAFVIALGTFIGKFWTVYEYSKYSIRGASELSSQLTQENEKGLSKEYAFQYSNDILGPFTMIIPNFLGGNQSTLFVQDKGSNTINVLRNQRNKQLINQLAGYSSTYWGDKPPAPYYIGAVIFFLFVLSLFILSKKDVWWGATIIVIGVVLGLGDSFSSFNYLVFDYLPGYNKFRSVTFATMMVMIGTIGMGFKGINELIEKPLDKKIKQKVLYSLIISAGLVILLLGFSSFFSFLKSGESQLPIWFTDALAKDRAVLLRKDAFRTLVFVSCSFLLVYLFLQKKISVVLLATLFIALVLIDMIPINARYFGDQNYRISASNGFLKPTKADLSISKDSTIYRVFNLLPNTMNEAKTSYHHQSLGGYHGAKLRRYQEFYTYCLEGQKNELIQNVRRGNLNFEPFGGINMLNAKYLTYGDAEDDFIKNNNTFGNGWLVNNILEVNSPDEELTKSCEVNLRKTAVIDVSKFKIQTDILSDSGEVKLVSYEPNRLEYKITSNNKTLAVFSEIYYPNGWIAKLNGEEQPILRSNYLLRALFIPKGENTVIFEFKPKIFALANTLTLGFNILLMIVVLATFSYEIRQKFYQ